MVCGEHVCSRGGQGAGLFHHLPLPVLPPQQQQHGQGLSLIFPAGGYAPGLNLCLTLPYSKLCPQERRFALSRPGELLPSEGLSGPLPRWAAAKGKPVVGLGSGPAQGLRGSSEELGHGEGEEWALVGREESGGRRFHLRVPRPCWRRGPDNMLRESHPTEAQ